MRNRERFTFGGGCSVAAIALLLAATPVAAQVQQTKHFDIQAGDLGPALNAFARQANQEIMFSSILVAGKRTQGIRGNREPSAALSALLKGTGLSAETGAGSVVTLRPARPATGGGALTPISATNYSTPAPYAEAGPGLQTQDAPLEPQDEVSAVEEIVVTGSRIIRNGYEAPTSTTVLGAEDIQRRAPANVADYINQLPQMGQPTSPRTTVYSATSTGGGANLLNARGLGATRTLVLLDGRRVVSAGLNSAVDINLLPTNLLQRVDVVTGGASAAYGSDAVAGVVNFILDNSFTGLKGSVNYGVTDRSDAESFNGDLAYGARFAGGRGHVLLSGQYFSGDGVDTPLSRDWYRPGYRLLSNPAWTATNGQPGQIVRYDAGYGRASPGGLITSGPLRGTLFGENGQIGQFTFGPIQNGDLQAGGTVEDTARIWPLLPEQKYWSTFGHVTYNLTNDIKATFEASYAGSDGSNWSSPYARQANITVRSDNPFLPLQIQQAMTANAISSFTMGRLNYDLVTPGGHGGEAGYYRRQERYMAALDGTFLETGRWRTYYQRGQSDVWYTRSNNPLVERYNQAIDVIANPAVGGVAGVAVGQPICRSQLTTPANGCVPMNIFGIGAPGQASIAWVMGLNEGLGARQDLDIQQDVWAIDAQYEPFSLWAGPVSFAAGFEWRKEQFTAKADAQSLKSAWFTGNFGTSQGKYDVNEFFVETLVPLLKDAPFASSLDFNGAVRRTDYSTSGAVTTWKAGLTWDINEELRLRGTRSRDIRAPNLSDLFAAGTAFQNNYSDPSQPGSPTVSTIGISGGNPNLKPEVAETWTGGVVYRPAWLAGFSASADYYNIEIADAIVAIGAQQLINQCYGVGVPRDPASCNSIIRAPGRSDLVDATIYTGGVNAQIQAVEGVDYELSYRTALADIFPSWNGSIDLRLLATQRLKDETELAGAITDRLNLAGSMKWNGLFSGTYSYGPSRTTLTVRYLGSGKVSNYAPTSQLGLADELNHFDAVTYVELAENFDIEMAGRKITLFGVVENLFDQDPEYIPGSYAGFGTSTQYDLLGRSFRVGARFRF
ncbi:MAG: TonB-dependent receptor [Brevundimonas sp.]|uniref:TonB-dependent receptor n=1 Tax=Brevundimonas sp. TaxID=1871086 RepID=UPI000DB778DA|nr:TonB-dependent receptor [Brevundimonas sp.]PZU01007.1 MAG: TonB-dependent receptor [Brevundimonas sp.]